MFSDTYKTSSSILSTYSFNLPARHLSEFTFTNQTDIQINRHQEKIKTINISNLRNSINSNINTLNDE